MGEKGFIIRRSERRASRVAIIGDEPPAEGIDRYRRVEALEGRRALRAVY